MADQSEFSNTDAGNSAQSNGENNEANKITGAEVENRKNSFISTIRKYPVLFTISVAIVAIAAVYYWEHSKNEKQMAVLEEMASAQIQQNNQDMLKLLSKPLIWAIRSEMMRDNLEQVDLFTSDLVKEKNFQFIYLIEPGGKIINSTDKKKEEQSAIGMFDNALLTTDSLIIEKDAEGILTMAAPVMGYDKKIALLVLKYKAPEFIAPGVKIPPEK